MLFNAIVCSLGVDQILEGHGQLDEVKRIVPATSKKNLEIVVRM